MEKKLRVYVPLVGQYDNIGDIILRRELFGWLREFGEVHAYVGPSPATYDSALRPTCDDHLYRSFREWYGRLLVDAVRGRAAYFFKPGELQASFVGMKEHVGLLPAACLVRISGHEVVRVGGGLREKRSPWFAGIWPSVLLSKQTYWREANSASYFGGKCVPDLAFGQGSELDAIVAAEGRDALVVSQRYDRPLPDDTWIQRVRSAADARGLEIIAVSQVRRDNSRTSELAGRLAGTSLIWTDEGHLAQEERLREAYRRASGVISDRLHVLIAALTEGASPICNLPDSHGKIARHMAAAGVSGVMLDVEADVGSILDAVDARRLRLAELRRARADLADLRDDVAQRIGCAAQEVTVGA